MFVLTAGSGSYVRPCPPERGFEYTSNVAEALKFATEADALAYLAQEHPIRKTVPQDPLGGPERIGPIVVVVVNDKERPVTFRRRSDLQHYVLNVGDV